MMKRFLTIAFIICIATSLHAQTPKNVKLFFTEASELNLIGKISDGTTNPYHRVDTTKYKGFTKHENQQVRCPAGIAVLFKPNSNIAENLEEVWHRITKDSPSYSKQGSSEISRLPCLIL